MKIIIKILLYLFLVSFLLLSSWQFFETTYWLVLKSYRLYLWFSIGILIYVIIRRLPFLRLNAKWFETWTHELIHTIVGLLFFQKIHSFRADEVEGEIYHSGHFSRNIFISLAPYCLPIYTYLFCVLRLMSASKSLWVLDLLIGLTLAFHTVCFRKQTRSYQTDIREFGLIASYLFIVSFLLFNATIVLLTVKIGIWNALIYQFTYFWKDIVYCWCFIS